MRWRITFQLLFITTVVKAKAKYQEKNHELCDVHTVVSDNYTDILADCSYRELAAVPDNLPSNITCLNLVGNDIIELKDSNWARYDQLKKLSLADNKINQIQDEDFRGLDGLEMLDLSLNYIRYTNITETAFFRLKKLHYLDLKQNLLDVWDDELYPTIALYFLTSLQTLIIDGLPTDILHLNSRYISEIFFSGEYGRCKIFNLDRNFFAFMGNVQKLYMSQCAISAVDACVFDILPELSSLDLSMNSNLGFDSAYNITCSFETSQTLKQLNLNSITNPECDMCSVISKQLAETLKSTPIELLTIEDNNIVQMKNVSIPYFLRYASVSGNMFLYGKYVSEIVKTGAFKNFVYFDTSQMFATSKKSDIPCYSSGTETRSKLKVNHSKVSCDAMFTRKQRKDYFDVIRERVQKYSTHLFWNESEYNVSLIQYLDISSNQPSTLEMGLKLFQHAPYLRFLNASNNYLGYPLLDGKPLFQNLSRLKTLDLSNSRLTRLHFQVFSNLTSVEELYLSSNGIMNISFDLSPLKKLSYLDLRSNHLEDVCECARTSLDALKKIKINLSNNPLKCNCQNVNFVKWLESKILSHQLEDPSDSNCTFINNTSSKVTLINYDQFYLECSPLKFNTFILVTSLGLFAFVIIVSCGLVYRYKWNLRYLYYMTKFKLIGGYQPLDNTQYEKDVFISYANEDRGFVRECIIPELEVKAGLRLLVHDRDFRAGEFVADNIVRAINSARWTLVILTRSYIRSKWCMYELNMARMEAADTGRTLLCVILKEDVPVKYMPVEVIDIIKKKTYIEFPDEEQHMTRFWERLRVTLSCASQ